jgi:hypothetical protein
LRDRPNEVRKVLRGALQGITFSKTRREEVLPLLKEFLALESIEMAKKAYDRMRDIWSDTGVPSDKALRTAASLAEVPATFPLDKLVNWSFLEEARSSLQKP